MTEIAQKNTLPVYRVENPNISARPNGITSHGDLVGQWFSPNLDTALNYIRKSTHRSRETGEPVNGTQLVVAQIPITELDSYHVSRHPIASQMDVENDNYIIPRDGSLLLEVVPLDAVIGELRGSLGNFLKFKEAKQRIVVHLGRVATEKEK